MKEYDRVELIIDREEYAKHQVFKGMEGWICDPRCIQGHWLVNCKRQISPHLAHNRIT